MIGAMFPVLALLGVFTLTLRSLGLGFLGLFAVGYFNGIIRANFLGIYTTFMFDAGLLGLYAGFLASRPKDASAVWATPTGQWVIALIAWPALLVLIPVNDFLVQLVALRATVWFLPVLLVATRLQADDLAVITRGLAVLNVVALIVGVYIYRNGVAALYPENAVTKIIYMSRDVAGYEHHRVPSTFLSAHAYGGAMLFSLPFLFEFVFARRVPAQDRALAVVGVVAAVAGFLMCAARQPAAQFVVVAIVAWVVSRFHPSIGLIAVLLVGVTIAVGTTDERLSRSTDFGDVASVSERVRGGTNDTFFDLMVEYPAGAGMGSSFGTSVPFFLADRAPKAIGLESEFCRILVDQGLIGLGLWLAFLGWLLCRPPPHRLDTGWGFGVVFMFALAVTNWATAFFGAGTLSAIPGSVLMLTQMGVLARVRAVAAGERT